MKDCTRFSHVQGHQTRSVRCVCTHHPDTLLGPTRAKLQMARTTSISMGIITITVATASTMVMVHQCGLRPPSNSTLALAFERGDDIYSIENIWGNIAKDFDTSNARNCVKVVDLALHHWLGCNERPQHYWPKICQIRG